MIADRRAEIYAIAEECLAKATSLEQVDYGLDVAPCILNVGNGPQVGYMFVVSTRSPVLVPPGMAGAHAIPDNAWPREPEIAAAIQECLGQLAATRQKLLSVDG